MKQQNDAQLYQDAFKEYFGTLQEVMRTPLPYTCKCGAKQMSIKEIWVHLRKTHRERLVSEVSRKAMLKRREEKERDSHKITRRYGL